MFINYSNHPSKNWDEKQLAEARVWGDIIDLPFLQVSPEIDSSEVEKMAEEEVSKILKYEPSAVLCQGEFTLCFSIIKRLQLRGIKVLAACSQRVVLEEIRENGQVRKEAIFRFVRFREYEDLNRGDDREIS